MEKLVCDRCGAEYIDEDSIEMAKKGKGAWTELCWKDGDDPRGIIPCPNISCPGELILKEA